MKHGGQTPSDGHDRFFHAAPFGDAHAPALQAAPAAGPRHENLGRFEEGGSHHGVTAFRDPTAAFDFAGLIALRREADMGAHGPGFRKARRHVDGSNEGERDDRARPHVILIISLRYWKIRDC